MQRKSQIAKANYTIFKKYCARVKKKHWYMFVLTYYIVLCMYVAPVLFGNTESLPIENAHSFKRYGAFYFL